MYNMQYTSAAVRLRQDVQSGAWPPNMTCGLAGWRAGRLVTR